MKKPEPSCIDCDHAFELRDDPTVVACGAHLEYRAADHPAICSEYVQRQPLAESGIAIVWDENDDS